MAWPVIRSIEVDCADATEVDLAAIQILLAARKSALNAKKDLRAERAGLRPAARRPCCAAAFSAMQPIQLRQQNSFWLKGTGA